MIGLRIAGLVETRLPTGLPVGFVALALQVGSLYNEVVWICQHAHHAIENDATYRTPHYMGEPSLKCGVFCGPHHNHRVGQVEACIPHCSIGIWRLQSAFSNLGTEGLPAGWRKELFTLSAANHSACTVMGGSEGEGEGEREAVQLFVGRIFQVGWVFVPAPNVYTRKFVSWQQEGSNGDNNNDDCVTDKDADGRQSRQTGDRAQWQTSRGSRMGPAAKCGDEPYGEEKGRSPCFLCTPGGQACGLPHRSRRSLSLSLSLCLTTHTHTHSLSFCVCVCVCVCVGGSFGGRSPGLGSG